MLLGGWLQLSLRHVQRNAAGGCGKRGSAARQARQWWGWSGRRTCRASAASGRARARRRSRARRVHAPAVRV